MQNLTSSSLVEHIPSLVMQLQLLIDANNSGDKEKIATALQLAQRTVMEVQQVAEESAGPQIYRSVAQNNVHSEGDIEVDDSALVSKGEGVDGAYVQTWKWISDDDAIGYLAVEFGIQGSNKRPSVLEEVASRMGPGHGYEPDFEQGLDPDELIKVLLDGDDVDLNSLYQSLLAASQARVDALKVARPTP